jgi:type I restriction enzyme S subunit
MLSDKTLRLVPNEEVADPGFVELALLSPRVRSQVKARATGTSASMKNISQAAVRQLLVPNVPTEQQRDVVETVRASRKRAEATRRQIAKLRSVQQGVVEDLLAGRVRVPEVASAEAA